MHCDLTPEIHHVSLCQGLLCLKASGWKPWTANKTVACKGTSGLSGLLHLSGMNKCLIDVHSKEGMRYYILGACYRLLLDEDSTPRVHASCASFPNWCCSSSAVLKYLKEYFEFKIPPVSYSSVLTSAFLHAILIDGRTTTQGKPGVTKYKWLLLDGLLSNSLSSNIVFS